MKIGVLGSGTVGQTLAAGFLKHGHEAMVGTRQPGSEPMSKWLEQNPRGAVDTLGNTVKFGELLVLATLGRAAAEAIELAGKANFAGKTLMDTTNPLAESAPSKGVLEFFTSRNESLGEQIQALVPEAHVVKAFNSVGAARMVNPSYQQGPPTMFLCGDDQGAKDTVSSLTRQLGWEPFDCGGIIASRALEPLCMLWCIPGFLHNQWTHAFKLLAQ
jgi:predicted dinucleotide-binding enzyme